jgi:predicted GNAT family acetyltransferase
MNAYLIRIEGEPACRCQLFSVDGIGRVEAVRTRAEFRRRGLASAAIRYATCDSLQRNQLTYMFAEPGGEAQGLYHRLGYEIVTRRFIRGFLYR